MYSQSLSQLFGRYATRLYQVIIIGPYQAWALLRWSYETMPSSQRGILYAQRSLLLAESAKVIREMRIERAILGTQRALSESQIDQISGPNSTSESPTSL